MFSTFDQFILHTEIKSIVSDLIQIIKFIKVRIFEALEVRQFNYRLISHLYVVFVRPSLFLLPVQRFYIILKKFFLLLFTTKDPRTLALEAAPLPRKWGTDEPNYTRPVLCTDFIYFKLYLRAITRRVNP